MKRPLLVAPLFALLFGCGAQNVPYRRADVTGSAYVASPIGSDATDAKNGANATTKAWETKTSDARHATKPVRKKPFNGVKSPSMIYLKPAHVRGIYVRPSSLRSRKRERLESFMRAHQLNAMVIDYKDDHGQVHDSPSIAGAIAHLHQHGIYTIARIVTFKDPALAKRHPAWSIQRTGGGLWTQGGVAWVDPYRPEVWRYNISLAKRAVALGYDEIQWDYVRFPDAPKSSMRTARFDNPRGFSKSDNIASFLKAAKSALPKVPVSADVFGLVTSSSDDMGIGQVWEKVSGVVDAISPMMYPSHYGPGIYGLQSPERSPDKLIASGLTDANRRNQAMVKRGQHAALIRPWLQDFSMRVPYRRSQVIAQIESARAKGITDYLLWNQGSRYSH